MALTASGLAAAMRGAGMAAAVNAAAPSIIDSYTLVMLFCAFGKMCPRFFDPKVSAATAHVMASLENLVAGMPPVIRVLRALVDAAGPTRMEHFFSAVCVAGAIVETLVGLLVVTGPAWLQAVVMFSMHGMFALTAFDFSAVASALFPIWGIGNPGGVSLWLSWILNPVSRMLMPILLLMVLYHPGGTYEKLYILRLCSHMLYIISCPLLYLGCIPPGAFFVGWGSDEQASAWTMTRAELGDVGGFAVFIAACAAQGVAMLNGFGPFIGLQTLGTYAVLYSNIVVERFHDEDSNHLLSPLFRRLGLPIAAIQDLVTVESTNAPQVARVLVLAPIAPFDVFANLVKHPGWERAGKCHWSSPVTPYIYTSVPGRKHPITDKEVIQVMPYHIPYFAFRCMISTIPSDQDFFVTYEHKGKRHHIERENNKTSVEDTRLLEKPNVYQRKVLKYRPMPVDFVF